jgi:hypothetical protein
MLARALDWTQHLLALAVILSSLEGIVARARFPNQGLLSWRISRLRSEQFVVGPRARVLSTLLDGRRIWVLLGARAAAALCLVLTVAPLPSVTAAAVAVAASLVIHYAIPQGHDGSDQMTLIVLVALLIARLSPPGSVALTACLVFIAGQVALSYFASGVAKLFGSTWRRGTAVSSILATRTFGSGPVVRVLKRVPALGVAATYATVALEVAFPLTYLLPQQAMIVALASFLLFHLVVATTMGLNSFVPAFAACYPATLWVHSLLA